MDYERRETMDCSYTLGTEEFVGQSRFKLSIAQVERSIEAEKYRRSMSDVYKCPRHDWSFLRIMWRKRAKRGGAKCLSIGAPLGED